VTTTPLDTATAAWNNEQLSASAREHLWMHFTRMSSYAEGLVPTIVRGEGARIYDARGRSYIDGLAGLFVVQGGQAGVRAGFLPDLVLCAPTGNRAGRPVGVVGAR
jgi:4-aminobutyrate aminotransferase-like enzyme